MKTNAIVLVVGLMFIFSCSKHPAVPDYYKMPGEKLAESAALAESLKLSDVDPELLEWAIFHETNVQRERLGRVPLRFEDRLRLAAHAHSQEMKTLEYFDHVSPVQENASVRQRIVNTGIRHGFGGENIAIHPLKKKQQIVFKLSSTAHPSRYAWRNEGAPYTYREFAEDIVSRWLSSAPHRSNILNRGFRFLGVGVAPGIYKDTEVFYITQNFSSTNY